MRYGLSKSRVMAWRQCPRKLWLGVHRPELADISPETETRFQIGFEVGDAARAQYPDGRLIATADVGDALSETQMALRDPPQIPLFEAAFDRDGVVVRVDLLLPETKGYRIVEVKASTSVKAHYREDVAIQAWAVQDHLPLRGVALAHVDNQFVYPGGGDYRGLFTEVDLTGEIESLLAEVPRWIADARGVLGGDEPENLPGHQCHAPYDCPFVDHCALPTDTPAAEYPLASLPRLSGWRLDDLVEQGVADIRQIPADYPLTERQRWVADCLRAGTPYLAPDLTDFARTLPWPRFFLDFETTQCAVPIWAGTRPYQQLPLQWSCHVQSAPSLVTAQRFLFDGEPEPLRAFAESLIATVCQPGEQLPARTPAAGGCGFTMEPKGDRPQRGAVPAPILVYNATFERRILMELAQALPDLAPVLEGIAERLVDLLPPLRAHYYHPALHGSWSLKSVAPVLSRVQYDRLAIGDGWAASEAWREILHPQTPVERRTELRDALVEYCGMDTWVMVEILNRLEQGPAPGDPQPSFNCRTPGEKPCAD